MDAFVASGAFGRIPITLGRGLSMNAVRKLFYLICVALLALRRRQRLRALEFVCISVAISAARRSKDGMCAAGKTFRFLFMASGALNFGNFRGMRVILDRGVTVSAAENPVQACGVLFRIDGYISARIGFHSRVAMAREAGFVLFLGMRFF